MRQKVMAFEDLSTIRSKHPNAKVVHCHGVFDVLHAGHISYFQSAKKFGDLLVVTLTTDRYVNKGPGRPYFTDKIRSQVIAALEMVDYVCTSDFPVAVPAIEALQPHFYVKGPDYRDKSKDVTGGIYAEESAVERHGGKLVFTEDETFSSSAIVNRFFVNWSEDQLRAIDSARQLGGENFINDILDRVSEQKVCIVGEPIVDTYRFCLPEAISSKSPSISARYLYEENYAGGSLAVANHLADFAKEVHLVISHGNEPYFKQMLKDKIDPRVKLHEFPLESIPTPRKVRYIAADNSQRMFEITDIRVDQWSLHSANEFSKFVLDITNSVDVSIISDFGHGMFEGEVIDSLKKIDSFVGLNVQTNSSNYGFNTFTKHKNFDFLSLDTREARISYHDRFTAPVDLGRQIAADLGGIGAYVGMTLGPNGSYLFLPRAETGFYSPAFADKVIDATGAGDAFFCLASCLVKVDAPPTLVPFVGNVFAGLKTKIIGNKNAVSKAQLKKAISAILK